MTEKDLLDFVSAHAACGSVAVKCSWCRGIGHYLNPDAYTGKTTECNICKGRGTLNTRREEYLPLSFDNFYMRSDVLTSEGAKVWIDVRAVYVLYKRFRLTTCNDIVDRIVKAYGVFKIPREDIIRLSGFLNVHVFPRLEGSHR